MGMDGPVGLNDVAINLAMDRYFEVRKRDRLELSKRVRYFYQKILSSLKEDK